EPVPLAQLHRRAVGLDAQADLLVPVRAGTVEQCGQQLVAEALPPAARHDRDRQLRRLLADEAVARRRSLEQAVPRGTDRLKAVDEDERGIARPPPAVD